MAEVSSFVPYVSDLAVPSLYTYSPANLSSHWTPPLFSLHTWGTPILHLEEACRSALALELLTRQQRRNLILGMCGDTSRSNVSAHRDAGRLGANSTCEGFQGTGVKCLLCSTQCWHCQHLHLAHTQCFFFFLFFFFPLMQLRNTVYKTQWVVCTLVSNPLCFLSV